MSMTLQELLDLLPDNNTGAIDAVDLRTIVTELYDRAGGACDCTQAVWGAYKWTRSGTINAGQVDFDLSGWATGDTTLRVSKSASNGAVPPYDLLNVANPGNSFRLRSEVDPTGSHAIGTITGVYSDNGSFWSVPVTIQSVVGVEPPNGEDMVLDLNVILSVPS